jgi:GTPase
MSTVKIALIGNVDSGKSTLVGVLSKGGLDDGRGMARKTVFVHPHEQITGRTSSISMEFLKLSDNNVCFIDLCGHEKYLKTTLFGLNLFRPHYCFLLVGANMGVSRMTRQHFNTVVALGYRTIVILTKIDITPPHILRDTIGQIKQMGKRYGRIGVRCQDIDSLLPLNDKILPIFSVSNVTGKGVSELRNMLPKLSLPEDTSKIKPKSESDVATSEPKNNLSVEFLIDNVYNVKGVGIVVAGFVQQGELRVNEKYQLCLSHQSRKLEVTVKSIQDECETSVQSIGSDRHATIFIKDVTKQLNKSDIRRGNMILSTGNCVLHREFVAGVYIFHHQTTLRTQDGKKSGYQCIINCNGIRQSAELVNVNHEHGILRSNDKRRVQFRFVYHDEYIKPGSVFTFREGSTIGVGKVLQIIPRPES